MGVWPTYHSDRSLESRQTFLVPVGASLQAPGPQAGKKRAWGPGLHPFACSCLPQMPGQDWSVCSGKNTWAVVRHKVDSDNGMMVAEKAWVHGVSQTLFEEESP